MHRCSDRRIYQPGNQQPVLAHHHVPKVVFLATTAAGHTVPHLLHDLVNFIADIHQLHATRGSRFGHQSIQTYR